MGISHNHETRWEGSPIAGFPQYHLLPNLLRLPIAAMPAQDVPINLGAVTPVIPPSAIIGTNADLLCRAKRKTPVASLLGWLAVGKTGEARTASAPIFCAA